MLGNLSLEVSAVEEEPGDGGDGSHALVWAGVGDGERRANPSWDMNDSGWQPGARACADASEIRVEVRREGTAAPLLSRSVDLTALHPLFVPLAAVRPGSIPANALFFSLEGASSALTPVACATQGSASPRAGSEGSPAPLFTTPDVAARIVVDYAGLRRRPR